MGNITGKRIKKLRQDLKLTGCEFGKKLDVTKTAVSNWENGNRTPDIDTINKIADYCNVSADYLLGRTDNPNHTIIESNYKGKNIELVINSTTKNYSQDQIQKLIDKLASMYVDVEKLIDK